MGWAGRRDAVAVGAAEEIDMPTQSGEPASSSYAITDLYDEQRGTFLVQYPILVVLVLALSGVAAFALTGFLGFSTDTGVAGVFHQAWLLFLWLCALLITLFASIFRDKSLRGRLIASLVVTLLAVVLVGVTYFSQSLPGIIRQLLGQHRLLVALAKSTYTYSVVNFGLLAIFWVDTVRRWMRRARGESPTTGVDIFRTGRRAAKSDTTDMPTLPELVSGDLIAGAVLAMLLAGLFWVNFLPNFVHPVDAAGHVVSINQCTLSWPVGACGAGGTPGDPPTLTFIDTFQALLYLPLGLLILALSATLSGFGAVGGVDEAALGETNPRAQRVAATIDRAGAAPIAEDVATTVLDTLKAALDRRLRLLGASLALSLRTVAWPCLIVIAVYAIANLATNIEYYLHSGKDLQALMLWVLPAAAYGLVAVLGAVASPALMLLRWRVAENTLRFLRLIGFIVLLTFWLFSLFLTALDILLHFTGAIPADQRHPFYPPSFATVVSFGALVVFGVIYLTRRSRGNQPTGVAVATTAPQASGEAGARPQR
jgi:hypothetical protein